MNYAEKQYEEIFEAMLDDSLKKGLISHAEEFPALIKNNEDISNYYVMDKSVIALMFSKVYKDLTKVYESAKVEYAEGSDLDSLGEILGISRPRATSAEVICVFTLNEPAENNISIPEGVTVSTDSGVEYITLEEIFISAEEIQASVATRAIVPGVSSKIVEHQITKIVDDLEYSLIVDNPVSSNGGEEEYNDDEYRYLLINWTRIHLKGSIEAYENYFASFNGIDSYKIIPNWDGAGTIKCVLDPGTDYQLNKAYKELQENITQSTEDIFMSSPTPKPIDIYAKVNVDIDQVNPYSLMEKEDIKSKIINCIKVFIDGGYRVDSSWYPGLVLGEDFIPHKLAVFLDDEVFELKNITFIYPEDYISILEDEIGIINSITIEMI